MILDELFSLTLPEDGSDMGDDIKSPVGDDTDDDDDDDSDDDDSNNDEDDD